MVRELIYHITFGTILGLFAPYTITWNIVWATETKQTPSNGGVIGGVVGALIVVIALVVFFIIYKKKMKGKQNR